MSTTERISLMEAIEQRHSVRQYKESPLPAAVIAELADAVFACNEESGLHIQLVTNEPDAFSGMRAKYGKFSGVSNYFAMVGRKAPNLEEQCGYYGEKLVLLAQQMGLNTCWVGGTFNKRKTTFEVGKDEKLVLIIAVGYGATQGHTRKSKSFMDVNRTKGVIPTWYRRGVEAALLAPTAINQQKFSFSYTGSAGSAPAAPTDAPNSKSAASLAADNPFSVETTRTLPGVHVEVDGFGFFSKVDLGIVRYHFQIGAGDADFRWI